MDRSITVANGRLHTAVWYTEYDEERDPKLFEDETRLYSPESSLTEIRFDGYYSGLLHFTLVDHGPQGSSEREFKFDYPPQEGEAVYGIQGHIFEVIDISNVEMHYKWKEID